MATITLYAGKMNQMSSLLEGAKKSVSDYQTELFSLKSKTLNVNKSVCDLDDVIVLSRALPSSRSRNLIPWKHSGRMWIIL